MPFTVVPLAAVCAAFVGAVGGSFGAAWVARWQTTDQTIATSRRSHCFACRTPIPPWLNVPVLSYLMLRGRAHCCGATLSPHYLALEVVGAAAGVAALTLWGLHVAAAAALLGAMLCAVTAACDALTMTIDQEVTLAGAAAGVLMVGMGSGLAAATIWAMWASAVGLTFWAFGRGLSLLIRRDALGSGDALCLTMLAAWLGPGGAAIALGWIASFLGLAGALVFRVVRGQMPERMPFCVPLGIAGILLLFWLDGSAAALLLEDIGLPARTAPAHLAALSFGVRSPAVP